MVGNDDDECEEIKQLLKALNETCTKLPCNYSKFSVTDQSFAHITDAFKVLYECTNHFVYEPIFMFKKCLNVTNVETLHIKAKVHFQFS